MRAARVPAHGWSLIGTLGALVHHFTGTDAAIEFARENQVLLMRHKTTAIELDLSLAWLSFELDAIAAAETLSLAGARLPVARAEDLVIYKALARQKSSPRPPASARIMGARRRHRGRRDCQDGRERGRECAARKGL